MTKATQEAAGRPVRMLPEEVANKIAAGEVVERPASVVKELVENALDAGATRVLVRLVAAGRRAIEVADNGCGMSEQDAVLAIERHTTSKIREAADLDNILSFGFRGEALASIASVSRFELLTRRPQDESATRVRVEGGTLRDVTQASAPTGSRISVNRLYFNTPVRAKFLKGIATELGRCIDVVQRFALSSQGVAFQLLHNEKVLLDIPENADLRERAALIWGLGFVRDMVDLDGHGAGLRFHGLLGTPALTRSSRTHQYFFLNRRPIVSRPLQFGLEDGYRQLLTIGRHPVAIVLIEAPPRLVDINIHPAKREVRFRDDRAVQAAMRDTVRQRLADLRGPSPFSAAEERNVDPEPESPPTPRQDATAPAQPPPPEGAGEEPAVPAAPWGIPPGTQLEAEPVSVQTEFLEQALAELQDEDGKPDGAPSAVYHPLGQMGEAPLQLFDTYLLIPEGDRLLIIDQHALHERLTYDSLTAELSSRGFESQELLSPIVFDVPPSYVKTLEDNLEIFTRLGFDIEPFGGNTFQIRAICHLYEDSRVPDTICRVLDHLAQGDLFSEDEIMESLLRVATEACRSSVKAGDRLTPEERNALLDGFRRLRPPYTCPHGRPIVTELTQAQMEKSFRRKQ